MHYVARTILQHHVKKINFFLSFHQSLDSVVLPILNKPKPKVEPPKEEKPKDKPADEQKSQNQNQNAQGTNHSQSNQQQAEDDKMDIE